MISPANKPGSAPASDLLAELSRVLWQQRNLIEVLEYRLEIQQLLMIAGKTARLALAVGEVEVALADIRSVEERRVSVVSRTAVSMGLPSSATLTQIRNQAPEPWDYVLADHQTELQRLVASTEDLANRNREVSQRSLADIRSAFETVDGPVTKTYGRHGDRSSLQLPPTLVNRQV
jgi:hypothetical protein